MSCNTRSAISNFSQKKIHIHPLWLCWHSEWRQEAARQVSDVSEAVDATPPQSQRSSSCKYGKKKFCFWHQFFNWPLFTHIFWPLIPWLVFCWDVCSMFMRVSGVLDVLLVGFYLLPGNAMLNNLCGAEGMHCLPLYVWIRRHFFAGRIGGPRKMRTRGTGDVEWQKMDVNLEWWL